VEKRELDVSGSEQGAVWALVNMAMNLWFPEMAGNLVTS